MSFPLTDVPDSVRREVGDAGLEHFRRVIRHSYGGGPTVECRFRAAPSFVMRSECEMLRISAPRFVYRALLNGLGHLDLRRLDLIGAAFQRLGDRPSHRLHDRANISEDSNTSDARGLLNDRPICGGSLVPPEIFRSQGYQFVDVDLSEELGEPQQIRGVPVVNMSALSGGLCSQACLIAAILLMKDHTNSIVGFVELTSFASSSQLGRAFDIRLGGLKPSQIVRCLSSREIGLSAHLQGQPDTENTTWVLEAIRDYVLSGFPVILPCDRRSLLRHVYGRKSHSTGCDPHAVLVVGASPQSLDLVVNDPADLPFLRVGDQQRRNIRLKTDDNEIAAEVFIEVCPKNVRVPLVGTGSLTTTSGLSIDEPGLFEVAELLRSTTKLKLPNDVTDVGKVALGSLGHFRLVHASSLFKRTLKRHFLNLPLPEELDYAFSTLQSLAVDRTDWPEWTWVQVREHPANTNWTHSVWLWDATKHLSPSPAQDAARCRSMDGHLIWCAAIRSTLSDNPGQFVQYANEELRTSTPSLKISVISSYSTWGCSHSYRMWPSGVTRCDLYAFMQRDVRKLDGRTKSAVSLLASLVDDPATMDRVFGRVAKEIKFYFPQGLEVSGIATYIPEITAGPLDLASNRGEKALRGAVQLAHRFCELQDLDQVVVEFVCGTRVDSVWKQDCEPRAYATIMEPEEAFLRLFEVLSEVSGYCGDNVVLAAEVEPGPLNVLNSLEEIRRFCSLIERYDLTGKVALNIDISHLLICGISPELLMVDDRVWPHVAHAHISGHCLKGHLADLVVGRGDGVDLYLTWLSCLENIAKLQNLGGVGRYQGHVAIEAEALASPSDIWESVNMLRNAICEIRREA